MGQYELKQFSENGNVGDMGRGKDSGGIRIKAGTGLVLVFLAIASAVGVGLIVHFAENRTLECSYPDGGPAVVNQGGNSGQQHGGQAMSSLVDRWYRHTRALDVNDDAIDRYWEVIQKKYSESQRHYHTLQHLEDMFRHFDTVEDGLQRPHLVAMAIFFHDVIYEPTEKDNEEKSAELFKEFAKESDRLKGSPDEERVTSWILETKHHRTDVHDTFGKFGYSDLYFFLDMDMAILGCPSDEYKEYARQIRQEYCHYSDEDFNKGRAKVLRDFLKVPNIFATQFFRDKFETAARQNVRNEIDTLEKEMG